MLVTIKRIDKTLPLPRYETAGAVAFDLVARETKTLEPAGFALVPTNIIVRTPPGYMLMLSARSSLAHKKGLMFANGVGVIDQDYCGPDDELKVSLLNVGKNPVTVERGERIGQGTFVRIDRAEWNEVEKIDAPSRGSFGTTGGYIGT
jgi:dUTP pyrophosphatase